MRCEDGAFCVFSSLFVMRLVESDAAVDGDYYRYDNEGKDSNFTSFSSGGGGGGAMSTSFKKDEFKDFGQIESEQLGLEKLDQFSIRATVVFVKPTAVSYPACPTPKCAKKMTMEAEDTWRCEKCDASFPAPDYRYVTLGLVIRSVSLF